VGYPFVVKFNVVGVVRHHDTSRRACKATLSRVVDASEARFHRRCDLHAAAAKARGNAARNVLFQMKLDRRPSGF